ncbi:MAG: phosphate signaling complex protein PhoU [Armatimonadetes bacterium]|nr:phosphate signaling complex protein PhoU [Armatimonadota bacterium]
MTREHTDRDYEAELRRLREQILLMGARVEEMIVNSMRALVQRDSELAERMMESDHEVNRLEMETDELCLRILARRQPVARDLRLLTISLKIVTDLERLGDLSVNLCQRVLELNQEPPLKPCIDLPRMADAVVGMVRGALDSFVAQDFEAAQRVIDSDEVVDAFYAQIFRELLTYMMEDPRNIYRATRLQSIAKYLERIADHATNLAEMVVFMVRGRDIRHTGGRKQPVRQAPRGILFLSMRNAARSQMAEAWARRLLPGVRVESAGVDPASEVNKLALGVMDEAGIDLRQQRPKKLSEIRLEGIDTIVTLGLEEASVPLPPVARLEKWILPDAGATGTETDMASMFRRVRDELRQRVAELSRVNTESEA